MPSGHDEEDKAELFLSACFAKRPCAWDGSPNVMNLTPEMTLAATTRNAKRESENEVANAFTGVKRIDPGTLLRV